MNRKWVVALVALSLSAPAQAKQYLTTVTSEVFQTTGTPREIAARASTCISQRLAAGTVEAPVIISTDLDNGVVVARNALKYSELVTEWKIRSVFTFEAREGRFRIVQTNLEQFNNQWGGIGKWFGSGWKKADSAFTAAATSVADCVMHPASKEKW